MPKQSMVKASLPASPWLIFDVHGGGFIAQSSKTHCGYLFPLAIETNVPVVCVNYSLAPQMQHPTQLHQVTVPQNAATVHQSLICCDECMPKNDPIRQVLSAYFWARKNCAALGWTGEKVCALGDSAGEWMVLMSASRVRT